MPVYFNSIANLVECQSAPHVSVAFFARVERRLQFFPSRRPSVRMLAHVIDNEVAGVPHGVCIRQPSKDVEHFPAPP